AGIISIEAGISAISGGAECLYILGDYDYEKGKTLINELAKYCKAAGCSLYYVFPQITRNTELDAIEKMLNGIEENNEFGLVLSNIGHIKIAQRLKIAKVRSNFSLNIANGAAADYLKSQGLESVCISPELNLAQIKEVSHAVEVELEALVYGYQPAMITEYCPKTAVSECDSCHNSNSDYGIMDERNKLFRIVSMGNCKTTILNSDVLCVYENLSNVIDSGISKLRLDFYIEKDHEVLQIVKAYKEKLNNLGDNKKNDIIEERKKSGYTKGHYFRGID
ncbi:MAG: hypothetical protein K0Q99_2262, partial [Clostridia bacterium]|nr:hypothetical protein [Clostridia bacterium]